MSNREYAAIDLGSNSFHMVVAREDAGQLRLIDRLREPVSLGSGLDENKHLSAEAQERAFACLEKFAQRLRGVPSENVRAVGTKTLRRAANARGFLTKAELTLGHSIDVIPGREEARLIYHGVRAAGDMVGEAPHLIVDIGGASTEIAVGSSLQPTFTESISAGCVAATRRHFAGGDISERAWQQIVSETLVELRPFKRALTNSQWRTAIGSSGSIKAIAGELARAGQSDGDVITTQGMRWIKSELLSEGSVNSVRFSSLSETRRVVFAGGCAVLDAVFQSVQIERLTVSQSALREGVLYELFGHTEDNVQYHTVDSMQRRFGIDREQSERAAKTIDTLLDSLEGDWVYSALQTRLLHHATALHEIGLAISHSQYHKHGEMLITRADMPGFTRKEQLMLATLVRLQRRRLNVRLIPDTLQSKAKSLLRMSVLLRIGLILCRDRQSIDIDELRIETSGNSITLHTPNTWLRNHPLTRHEFKLETKYALAAGFALSVNSD